MVGIRGCVIQNNAGIADSSYFAAYGSFCQQREIYSITVCNASKIKMAFTGTFRDTSTRLLKCLCLNDWAKKEKKIISLRGSARGLRG